METSLDFPFGLMKFHRISDIFNSENHSSLFFNTFTVYPVSELSDETEICIRKVIVKVASVEPSPVSFVQMHTYPLDKGHRAFISRIKLVIQTYAKRRIIRRPWIFMIL